MTHLYFAACAENGGVYHYLWNQGEFRFCEKTPMDRPMYLDVEGDTLHVLLRAPWPGNDHSALVDYPIKEDGSLGAPGERLDTQGVCACHLCHLNGKVYWTNYLSGNVGCSCGKVDAHSGKGVHPTRQEAPHTHFIFPTPDGKYLLSNDLGLDTVFTYDEHLNVLHRAKVPAGHGCRHLAFHADGKKVFCANELTSTVSVFELNADGSLNLLETVETLAKPNPQNTAAAIRVLGDEVFVSQRGEDSICRLRWDGAHLRMVSSVSCEGISPRDFMIWENQIIITNEKSNNVTVLSLDGNAMTDTGIRLTMENPLCVVAVPEKKGAEQA